ncbi:MAG TPA: hypothetical protein VHO91_09055 [Rhodopila sp.]|nr:hypothetical protein [Rhodopila sp.]
MPVPFAILDTVLAYLAPLFLEAAGNDPAAAREAAHQVLLAYNPNNEAELALAAEIVGFSLHALEALGQSAEPELSVTRQIRLRGSAVSLSREAHKSRRKLAQLQSPIRTAKAETARAAPPSSQPEPRPDRPKIARQPGQSWTQAYRQHRKDRRLAEPDAVPDAAALQPLAVPHPQPVFAVA